MKSLFWVSVLTFAPMSVAVAIGQEQKHEISTSQSPNQTLPLLVDKEAGSSEAEMDKEDWTEYEIRSLHFQLPDYWQVVAAEHLDMENHMSAVLAKNPHLKQSTAGLDLKDLDVWAINTRDSSEDLLEVISIKIIDRSPFDQTTLEKLMSAILAGVKETLAPKVSESKIMDLAGKEVGRLRHCVDVMNLKGRVVSVESLQYIILEKEMVVLVTFQHMARSNSNTVQEVEDIVKTFGF
jgi:hypothetical protein